MHSSASQLFPRVVPASGQLGELERCAQEAARFAEREILLDKARNERLLKVETDSSQALKIVSTLAKEFEDDRADRRRMFSRMAWLFGALVALLQLLGGVWYSYKADERERDRDARDLNEAVERARSHQRGTP
jgi:hypothetical protein